MTPNRNERAKPLRTGDPRELGDYRITGRIGRGGMGTVYLATGAEGREVAVKLIHPDLSDDPDFRRRFAREVESARRVARFSTAAVLDAQLEGEPLYIVSEYVAGPNLAEAITAEGPMSGGTLESLAMGVAAALAAIHGSGVIHRDLKPANVLLSAVGPKVIDFGIARALDEEGAATRSSQLMGTPAYLAPELILGRPVTPASDIFSWGCLVAFAGTGKTPFDAPTIPAVLHQISTEQPNLEGLDPTLHELVATALDKEPQNRPTAQQILDRLVGHETPSESEVDRTVARSWTPPAAAAGGAGAPETADGSGPQQPVTPTEDLAGRPTARMPPGPGGPYDQPHPPGVRPAHLPPGPPSGPQAPYGGPYGAPSGPQSPYGPPPYPPGGYGAAPPPPGPQPGRPAAGGGRRRTALIAGAAGGAALLLAAVAIVALNLGGEPVPDGQIVYADEFTSTETGWGGGEEYLPGDDGSFGGYYDGHFVVRADEETERRGYSSPYEGAVPERVLITAEAVVVSGPDHGRFGVHCFRSEDDENGYYEAVVTLDGGSAEIRRRPPVEGADPETLDSGEPEEFTETDPEWEEEDVEYNSLALSCELDSETETMELKFWINGRLAAEAVDEEPLPDDPEEGRITGLTTWRTAGSGDDVVVMYDSFELYRLEAAAD